MLLSSFGDGIFRTHVTFDDIQENCKTVFGESAVFGPNKSVKSIGDGRGFMSKMCLVDPDWQHELKFAPKQFVVKICTQVIMRETAVKMNLPDDAPFLNPEYMENMASSVRKVHNNEVNFYEIMKKYKKEGLAIPKMYFASRFTEGNPIKGYIIMEFIEDAVNLNLYDNVTVEDMKQPLRSLAALQAISAQFSEEQKSMLNLDVFGEIFAKAFSPEALVMTMQLMRKFFGEKYADQMDKIEKAVPELTDFSKIAEIGKDLGISPVLCHGDLWATNLIWKNREKGGLQLAAFVDFQTTTFGLAAVDLCRLMCACLSAKDRKEHEGELIDTFYGYLKEEMEGQDVPYTLEQLHESIRRFKPIGAFLLVPGLGPLFEMNNQITDVEEKQKVMDLILEKGEGLMDDIVNFYEKKEVTA